MEVITDDLLKLFGLNGAEINAQEIGSGHINRTFLVSTDLSEHYILQQINTLIFKNPQQVADNIREVAEYLKFHFPGYIFPSPIQTETGDEMAHVNGTYWRLFPYIPNSVALETLFDPRQAFEAAKQFGKLTRLLNDFPLQKIRETIPGFHNLNLRFLQFTEALKTAESSRCDTAAEEINHARHHSFILDYYNSFVKNETFRDRVMHHDTKISNVLLNKTSFEGICVIDLDTLMPGKFISDLGDMIRTYVCAFSENEQDLSKITIRMPYFKALINGYLSEMADLLTPVEKELILFSGKYIVYMQALRFLTDFLNGNTYYPVAYPEQNLDRAKNQFKLLFEIYKNEAILQDLIDESISKYASK